MLAAELAGLPEPTAETPGETTEAMAGMPKPIPGMPNPIISQGGVSQPGRWVENQPSPESPLSEEEAERRDARDSPDSDHDPDLDEMKFLEEPWFAKLPPDVRTAIRNNARHRAPRGYRERLKRYFENLD